MKRILENSLKILLVIGLLIGSYSCSDSFLEVSPKGVLKAETTNDYDLLLNSSEFGINFSGVQPFVIRSFEACGLEPHFSISIGTEAPKRNNFTWEPGIVDVETEGRDFNDWLIVYTKRIYIYNKIINEVLSSKEGTESEKTTIWAEALAARASVYFELVNLYGKPYNAVTASEDPGVPLLTDGDVTKESFTRSTVQEVYDFIINDLNESIPLLPADVNQRPRMSKGAAQALLGKVYIYMQNYNQAATLLDEAITNLEADPLVELYDYNVTTLPGGPHEKQPWGGFFPVLPVDNTEVAFSIPTLNEYTDWSHGILLSPQASALYQSSDFRFNHFLVDNIWGTPFGVPGIYKNNGFTFSNRGVRLSNIYLFRAESRARTNDLAGAIQDLEFLRSHRMPVSRCCRTCGIISR